MYGKAYTHINHYLIPAQALEAQRGSRMDFISGGKEVQDLIQVSETLLSRITRLALTPEKCELITGYVMSLSHLKQPWSKSLVLRYGRH